MLKWLLGGAVLTAAGLLIKKSFDAEAEKDALMNWQMKFEGLSFKNLTWTAADLELKLRIINSSSIPLKLNSIYLEVFDGNNRQIGTIQRYIAFQVRANGSDLLVLPAAINNTSFLQTLVDLVTNKTAKAKINLIGYAMYQAATVNTSIRYPINFTQDLTDQLPFIKSLQQKLGTK